jgi:hypothetical protein
MRRSMTFKRLLPCATALAFLIPAAPAFAQDGGGVAVTADEAAPAAVAQTVPDAAPDAVPAQDQTPTTPGGEEQPPEQQPDGEQPPSSEPNPETTSSPQAGVGGETAGGLPRTGWQAFALGSIGLGLLLAGAALWPTSSWPPPRDRLSRSTMRR